MLHTAWCYVLRTQHFSMISYTSVSTVSTFHTHGFTVKHATCCVRQLFWDTCMHENVTTIKLPNLDQTALYFVMALVSRDVAGIPCIWFDQGGSPEEGKEENTEKVRLYYNHIPAEYLGTLKLRHQGNPCSHHLWCIYLWKNRHHT